MYRERKNLKHIADNTKNRADKRKNRMIDEEYNTMKTGKKKSRCIKSVMNLDWSNDTIISIIKLVTTLLLVYPILASANSPPYPSVSTDASNFSIQNGQTKQITFNVQNNGGNSTTSSYLSISVSNG